jgi:hypothetical protein
VGRGCLFSGFAIAIVVFALIEWPSLAMRSGAYLLGLVAIVLVLRAFGAATKAVHRTETWLLLGGHPSQRADPPTQAVVGRVLRVVYLRFATGFGALSVLLLVLSFGFRFAGR